MAYRGLVMPVIARRVETEDGVSYTDGIVCGRAIKVEVNPVYEDVSDYDDINETDEKKEFAYANITLNTGELPPKAEENMFGHEVSEDSVISKDTDLSEHVGFGFHVTGVFKGTRKYMAIWLHCVRFTEDSQEYNTKGSNPAYDTPVSAGVAVPEENGVWRTKKIFATKNEAVSWLKEMAGIKEE